MNVFHESGPPLILFKYQPTRKIEFLREILRDYKGAVMTDDYAGYDYWLHNPGSPIKHQNCMAMQPPLRRAPPFTSGCLPGGHRARKAHVRRKFFEDAINSKNSLAMEGFQIIRGLYGVEKIAREENFTSEQKLALRKKESVPIMNDFHRWLLKSQEIAYPRHPLENAVSYTLKIWPRLQYFLTDGRLPIDNNIIENAIRPFALGRKTGRRPANGWLFAAAEDGASASGGIYSITQSAKLNGHDVYKYLFHLFEELPKANS